jgi:hypothetical protein
VLRSSFLTIGLIFFAFEELLDEGEEIFKISEFSEHFLVVAMALVG